MKNNIFHKGFYLDTLKRIKVISLIVIFLSVTVSSVNGLITLGSYYDNINNGGLIEKSILSLFDISAIISPISTLGVPILVLVSFSYLYKRNESDFFESLPIKRSAMAISGILAVLTVFVATMLSSVIAYLLITIPCIEIYYTIDFLSTVLEVLAVLIAALFSSSIMLLGISVTGKPSSGVIAAFLAIIVPRTVMSIFLDTLKAGNAALVDGKIFPILNPTINLHYSLLLGKFHAQENAWNYIYTAILSLILLIIAIHLFNKRGSETISQGYVKHRYRHIFAIALAFLLIPLAIEFIISYDNMALIGIILSILALIVFVAFEKIEAGKRNKNRGGFIAFLCLLILTVGYVFGINIAQESLLNYSPDADDIEYISVVYDDSYSSWLEDLFESSYLQYYDYVEMRASNIELDDREIAEIISKALKDNDFSNENKMKMTVKIKSGRVHYRTVYLDSEDYYRIKEILSENEKYNEIWLNIDEGARYPKAYYDGVYIYHDMMEDILYTMKSEIEKYGIEAYRSAEYESYAVCSISYSVYYNGEEKTVGLPVYEYMVETIEKLEQARKSVAEQNVSDFKNKLLDAINQGKLSSINVYVYTNDDYYYLYLPYVDSTFDIMKFSADLSDLVSSDVIGESSVGTISITISTDGIFGGSRYYSFAINSEYSGEEIKAFFEKYDEYQVK